MLTRRPHDANQRLLFGFALGDLPVVVVVEHGVAELSRHLRHLHLLDGQEIKNVNLKNNINLGGKKHGTIP